MAGRRLLIWLLLGSSAAAWGADVSAAPAANAAGGSSGARAPADGGLFQNAVAEARQKMEFAESEVLRRFEKTPAHLSAKLEVAKQNAIVDSTRTNGDAHGHSKALADLAVARRALKALEKAQLEQDAAYSRARDEYNNLLNASTIKPDAAPGDESQPDPADKTAGRSRAIRKAIHDGNFVVGMTYDECVRAAGSDAISRGSDGVAEVDTWEIRRVKGRQVVVSHDANGITRRVVPEYEAVGYVEARFVDDKLMRFEVRAGSAQPGGGNLFRPQSGPADPSNAPDGSLQPGIVTAP